jgi:hypothetical protein
MKPRRPLIGNTHPSHRQGDDSDRPRHGLLSVRSALVLALAALAGIGGAGLLSAAHRPPSLTALGAIAVFAGALQLLNNVIE